MSRWTLSLCLLFTSQIANCEVLDLKPFKSGLCTRYSANSCPQDSLTIANNILLDVDADGIPVRRKGYAKFNASALTNTQKVRGVWQFDDVNGNHYLVAVTSGAFYSSTGDGTFTAITGLSGFSSALDWNCTAVLGKFWCANGVTGFYWDGTATATVSGITGNLIENFRNRVLVSGISGSAGTLLGSGELNGLDYTLPTVLNSTSPFSIKVGGVNDGQGITCLMGTYNDVFIIGKRDSLWGLYGFSNEDFQLRELSRQVGCLENNSVQEKNGCLYWLSRRGQEKMCGYDIQRISDPIRDQIAVIIDTAGNPVSVTDSSQQDWEAGNLSASGGGAKMSATVSPGNLTVSSWSTIDTDFSSTSSYSSQIDTTTLPGRMLASDLSLTNAGFETGSLTPWGASGFSLRSSPCDTSGNYGTYSAEANGTLTCGSAKLQVINGSTGDLIRESSVIMVGGASSCGATTIDVTTQTANTIKLRMTDTTGTYSLTSPAILRPNGTVSMHHRRPSPVSNICYFDTPNPYYASTGTYISQAYDTTFSTPIWGAYSSSFSSGTVLTAATFGVQVSADAVTWDASVTPTSGSLLTNASKRYIRHSVAMTSTRNFGATYIDDVSLAATTTGYFISQCRNPGGSITAWGSLSCTAIDPAATLSLFISTGGTCNSVTTATASFSAQANGSPIAVPVSQYVSYKAVFNSTATVIQDCTIDWQNGATRPPVASAVYDDRYYIAYTSNTAAGAANDHILVLDRGDRWTIFDNHTCYSLSIYQRGLYCGDSGDTGRIYNLDTGTDDNGASFTAQIRTPAFDIGAFDQRKIFHNLYLLLEPSPDAAQTVSLSAAYILDRGTTTISLGSIDLNESPASLLTAKVPFSAANPYTGHSISLDLQNTGTNVPWRLFGARLHYSLMDPD